MASEEGIIVMRRAEIDTSAPFRSVKEAVILFGEKVLATEVYANKLKEMRVAASENGHSRLSTATAELDETKQNLTKAKEESVVMASCLYSLKEELEQTKRELQQLKLKELKESEKRPIESEIEDLKFVENTTNIEFEEPAADRVTEFQRKRYVTFANPPLSQVLNTDGGDQILERVSSMKKKKKKPLIPLIGGIFSKKKGPQEGTPPRVQGP